MNEYSEGIKLNLTLDDKEVAAIEKKFANVVGPNKDALIAKAKEVAELTKKLEAYNEMKIKEAKIEADKIQKQLEALTGEGSSKESKDSKSNAIGSFFIKKLTDLGKKFIDNLGQTFKDAWKELQDITQYSFNTNSQIRELKFGYGFSSSEAYGYDKAMKMLGFSSMEDMFYADDTQIAQFKHLFEKYTEYYETTMTPEMVQAQLEYQIAMQEFKQDLQNTVIKFFVDNQDEIIALMNVLMDVAKLALEVFGWILKTFSSGGRSEATRNRETASILNSYVSNAGSTYNVTTNNTYNGVTTENQQMLTRYGDAAIKSFIKGLGE